MKDSVAGLLRRRTGRTLSSSVPPRLRVRAEHGRAALHGPELGLRPLALHDLFDTPHDARVTRGDIARLADVRVEVVQLDALVEALAHGLPAAQPHRLRELAF